MDSVQCWHAWSDPSIVRTSDSSHFGALLTKRNSSVARLRRLGIRHLQIDDYVMAFGLIWYTILCVALNKVTSGGGSNLMTPADIAALTPAIYEERVRGSKWVFVSEHAFILTVWSCKACMLVIYARIT
jgi:hypothetical protein